MKRSIKFLSVKLDVEGEGLEEKNKTYGLLTAIAMIVGTVVGSGIYFKADDILSFTGGNVTLGVLVILLGAVNIVFGSLTLAQLALRTTTSGGLAGYAEIYYNQTFATVIGLFQSFIYIPVITTVVTWVASSYTLSLLKPNASFETEIILTIIYLFIITIMNYYSKQLAGFFQSLSTFIKVIPLIIIMIMGLIWQQPIPAIPSNLPIVEPRDVGFGWLAALVPLAFTFDGWNVVTNIAPELKNAKRNLPLAYILGPIFILVLYVSYFVGLNNILGETFILSTGNHSVNFAFNMIFGRALGNVLIIVVIISVLGVANGMFLANIRLPQAMAEKGWIQSAALKRLHPQHQLSTHSTLLVMVINLLWLVIHYFVFKYQWLPNSDISESAVVFNNLCLLPIYYLVFQLYKKGQIKNKFFGIIAPLFATLGILVIVLGNFILNFKAALITSIVGILFILLFWSYAKRQQSYQP